jgi:hypothetical protein
LGVYQGGNCGASQPAAWAAWRERIELELHALQLRLRLHLLSSPFLNNIKRVSCFASDPLCACSAPPLPALRSPSFFPRVFVLLLSLVHPSHIAMCLL